MTKFYTHKKIDVTFTKTIGTFAESGTDTVKLSGLRVSALVTKAGGTFQGSLEMRIWGLTLSKMNDLATLGYTIEGNAKYLHNTVLVEAGDAENGMASVFYGTIYAAWSDFMGMPDNPFHVMAAVAIWEQIEPAQPTSYRGLVDVATILSGIADLVGWTFVNNGVTTQFENVYYPGTAKEQIERVCQHANIYHAIDDGPPATLTIWPKNGTRGGAIQLISPETGMVGYPTYTANGIMCTTLFNPSIRHGGQVQVKSDLTGANKTWAVQTLSHTLDSEVPRGSWYTRFEATEPGLGSARIIPR
jgi:hypothetical protein